MSTREKAMMWLERMPESQIAVAEAFLHGIIASLEEQEDELFCENLLQQCLSDPDHGQTVTEEEVLKELGIAL